MSAESSPDSETLQKPFQPVEGVVKVIPRYRLAEEEPWKSARKITEEDLPEDYPRPSSEVIGCDPEDIS